MGDTVHVSFNSGKLVASVRVSERNVRKDAEFANTGLAQPESIVILAAREK